MDGLIPYEAPEIAVTVDYWPHPLTEEGRDTHTAIVPAGTTLAELVRLETGASRHDVAQVLVDGIEMLPEEWDGSEVRDGEMVTVRIGGEGGNFFRTLLTFAVIAAAIYFPPALGLTGVSAAIASAAISIVGGLIVNALFPVRPPDIGGIGSSQPDPVYSIVGGSNRARLYEPLPLVLGEHRVFPDLGAKEYTWFSDGNQYLAQIFNFGRGDLDISDLRIDATLAADYSEVATERGDAQGRIALVAGNVDTATGAALDDDQWVIRQSGADTDRISIDITGRLFSLNDRGEEQEERVDIEVRYWKAGESPPAPQRVTVTNDSQAPVRRTFTYDLPERATWNVSVRRTTEPSDEERVYDEITWAALRSFQPDTADYTGQNRLGVTIRASGQLNGRLDRVSALVRQKIPVWDAVANAWGNANVASSNPAALFVWYARGIRLNGSPRAGVGLPDRRIDLAGLGAWYVWCHAQGLRCDFEIKGGMTHDAVLTLIAQCGRASVSWQTGKLGVVYEDAARIPSGLVTPGNVIKGTFRYEYAQGEIADEVIVRYIEPDLDWQYNSVRRSRPGLVGTPQSSVTVTARGVTQRDQAAVECNLQVARQHYHRRRLVWEMGREGRSYTKGSVVWITHSLIDGGTAGRLEAIVSASEVRLDKTVAVGGDDYLLLRLADGTIHQSRISGAGGDNVRLATPLPAKALGNEPVDVLWRHYDSALPPAKARIVAFEPVSDRRFRLTAIDEVAAYYALATSDLTAPFPGISDRIPRVVSVLFSDRRISTGNGYAIELQAALTVSGDWKGGVVRAGRNFSELETVDRLAGGDTIAKWIVPEHTGQAVEIVPGTEDQPTGPVWRGSWMLRTVPPPPPTGLSVREIAGTKLREVTCTPPDIPDLKGVRVRFRNDGGNGWDDAELLAEGPIATFPYIAAKPGGGTWKFLARTEATDGSLSTAIEFDVTLDNLPTTFAGVTWHTVSGVPPASLGADGDRAVRIDEAGLGRIYARAGGAWTLLADLAGADGAQWHTGTGAPQNSLGADGDWYLAIGEDLIAGTVYTKASGSWQRLFDIDNGTPGSVWHGGSGLPAGTLGNVGDFYFRTDTGGVYEKTGATTWAFQRDITGPQGDKGDKGDKGDRGDKGDPGEDAQSITAWYDQIRFQGWSGLGIARYAAGDPADLPKQSYDWQAYRGTMIASATFTDSVQSDGSIHGTATITKTGQIQLVVRG